MPYALMEKVCAECGSTWTTRTKSAETCSPKCRALLREKRTPSKGSAPKQYPEELVRQVRDLYESGMTMEEVASSLATTSKVVWRLMDRHGISRRKAAKRNQTGERNHMWKGGDANYQALHLRVEAARGKPQRCSCCDTTDAGLRYEWANLSGNYEDVNDYARLCVSCHRRLDARRREQLGRPTSPRGRAKDE